MLIQTANFDKPIAQIVRDDYRTADVLRAYGINYCCGGNVLLAQACQIKNLPLEEVTQKLERATSGMNRSGDVDFNEWRSDFLIDYILHIHHAYLTRALPSLQSNLNTFLNTHKNKVAHLSRLGEVFHTLVDLLQRENELQEEVIFPYIKQMDSACRRKETYGSLFVRTLRKPLNSLLAAEGELGVVIHEVRQVTSNYDLPQHACTTHHVIFHKLHELEQDLIQHKHLENNILLPRAKDMERQLLQS